MPQSFLFPLLLLLSSCAFILDKLGEQPKNYEVLPMLSQTYCPQGSSPDHDALASSNNSAVSSFSRFLDKSEIKKEKLSFWEKSVLWSLLQMSVRPEASSPTARMQILVINPAGRAAERTHYWDFKAPLLSAEASAKDVPYPYLQALQFLLRHGGSRRTLLSLAKLLEEHRPGELKTSEDFVAFLAKNKKDLESDSLLFATFFRGDEPLRLGEAMPPLELSKNLAKFSLAQTMEANAHLFTHRPSTQSPFEAKCNYDMGLYENSLFLVNKNPFASNVFGMRATSGEIFFAVSSQYFERPNVLGESVFIKGQSNVRTAALCFLQWKETAADAVAALISTDERDPGQHLFHIIHDGKIHPPSLETLNQAIIGPRHLFLSNPVRLIVETRRTSRQQLDELIALQVPIYHSLGLGKVWAALDHRGQSAHSGLVLDDRKHGYLTCP